MKKILLLSLLLLLSKGSHAQTADDIIEKHTKAIGGYAKLKNVKSVYVRYLQKNENNDAVSEEIISLDQGRLSSTTYKDKSVHFELSNKTDRWNGVMDSLGKITVEHQNYAELSAKTINILPIKEDINYVLRSSPFLYLDKKDIDEKISLLKDKTISRQKDALSPLYDFDCYVLKNNKTSIYYYISKDTYHCLRKMEKRYLNGIDYEIITDYYDFEKGDNGLVFHNEEIKYSVNNDNKKKKIIYKTTYFDTFINEKLEAKLFTYDEKFWKSR